MNILNYTAAIIAIHDGGLPVFETETDYQIHVDEVPTCTTVTSLYSKNSVFIPPQKYSNTVIKKNAHCSRARGKKSQPVIWDKQTPFQASNCSCLHAHWAKSQASHISIQSRGFTDYFCRLICHHKHVGVDRAYKLRAYICIVKTRRMWHFQTNRM